MAYETTHQHLVELAQALQETAPEPSRQINEQIRNILRTGWAPHCELEDLLYSFDRRLYPYGAGNVDLLAKLFKLNWTNVASKPHKRASCVYFNRALSAFDTAHLLINLEALGFNVDPSPLATALLPAVENLKFVSDSQLSVLWYFSRRHRGEPLAIRAANKDAIPALPEKPLRTSTGYRIQPWHSKEGELLSIQVHAPKFRAKPSPVEVTCPECGVIYFRGDFDSGVHHRREHRERMAYLDPKPHTQLISARESDPEATLVTHTSSAWKHAEMYVRARAFKHEFHYDFVQWGSRTGDNDPHAHGFLLTDERSAIIGACAFRRRHTDEETWWALQWIWICPLFRRQGYLKQYWPSFRHRFGDFVVEAPVSSAMRAFLISQNDGHLEERSSSDEA